MRRSLIAACAGFLGLASTVALAEDDVPEQAPAEMVLCALRNAVQCTSGAGCMPIAPDGEVPLPDFLWIDFVDQRAWSSLSGPDDATPIFGVHQDGRNVMLYGVQDGLAWAMGIDAETGSMALTGAEPDGVRSVFGVCTRVARPADGE